MRLADILLAEPLFFHEPSLAVWLARMSPMFRRLSGVEEGQRLVDTKLLAQESQYTIADFINQRRDYNVTKDGFAVIHANDALGRGLTKIDCVCGATDYNSLIAEAQEARKDRAVKGVMLDISSPGGSAIGAPEAAAAIEELKDSKPVVSYIEIVGASAAYYFASPSHAIVASPSAVVGSVGTIATFTNIAGLLANFGVQITQLTGGDLKAAGTPFREMSRAEREFLQGRVDELTADFRACVQTHRPSVGLESLQGQWFAGSRALQRGLVDQVGSRADAFKALRALASL